MVQAANSGLQRARNRARRSSSALRRRRRPSTPSSRRTLSPNTDTPIRKTNGTIGSMEQVSQPNGAPLSRVEIPLPEPPQLVGDCPARRKPVPAEEIQAHYIAREKPAGAQAFYF